MNFSCSIEEIKYGKSTVLREVAFSASSGSFLAVVGKNGTGKSTLISALSGILPFSGKIMLDDTDMLRFSPRERARHIALMPQLLRAPHITVEELVSFGRSPYLAIGQRRSEADKALIEDAIRSADLMELRECYLDRISGGELRRAYFGMLLAQDTPVMLLDEATAFLDAEYESQFLSLLKKTAKEQGKIVISVMHHLEEAVRISDAILLLGDRRMRFFGSPQKLLETDLLETTFSLARFSCEGDGEKRIFFSPK